MTTSAAKLIPLLREAERRLRPLGEAPLWSSYDSGSAIADFVAMACEQLQAGDISDDVHKELWRIFAPTCDWDDVIGDVDLGNAIFDLIEQTRRRDS